MLVQRRSRGLQTPLVPTAGTAGAVGTNWASVCGRRFKALADIPRRAGDGVSAGQYLVCLSCVWWLAGEAVHCLLLPYLSIILEYENTGLVNIKHY